MSVFVSDLVVSVASESDAAGMVEVIHAAFGARPALDPPSTADAETVASVRESLRRGGGIYATVDGRPAGALLVTPAAMQQLGERLAGLLRPGDVVIATGDLGAGKTTLTQGIGRGLGTTGRVISPTFVLSRIHASTTGRPRLVHVDAYRLGGPAELDDLDLDATVADSVTVVEWGRGVAEGLADDRLEIDIWRSPHANGHRSDSERVVTVRPVGSRWPADSLTTLVEPAD